MDRITCMSHFVEVVKGESFTAAADKFSISRAQISKSVMHLEKHLGTRLLNRTTRRVSLTETGQIYYERCLSILEDIAEVECIASEQANKPSGILKDIYLIYLLLVRWFYLIEAGTIELELKR